MATLDHILRSRSRSFIILGGVILLVVIGVVDYLTGFEILFSVFYLLEVGLATWFVGTKFGLVMSLLSVVIWIGGDMAAGAHYSRPFVPVWNAVILLVLYIIVVGLLGRLRILHGALEAKVRERTRALEVEMAERLRLEKEILEVSEREQRRLGHDLHDSLCQHLTATALAGQVLSDKLAAKQLRESADAEQIVSLVEDGITLARDLARGIVPVNMEEGGLASGLRDLAKKVSSVSKIKCSFEHQLPVRLTDQAATTHLYRITQEAISNALRHGKARNIVISLETYDGGAALTIEDDGQGLADHWQKAQGLGTRIMAHRARMIGGTISVEANPTGGTLVRCQYPLTSNSANVLRPQPQPFPAQ